MCRSVRFLVRIPLEPRTRRPGSSRVSSRSRSSGHSRRRFAGWTADLRRALAFLLSLPLGGLIEYRYLVGTGRLRHQLRFGAILLTRAQEARRLVAERREILGELERAKRDYVGRAEGPGV